MPFLPLLLLSITAHAAGDVSTPLPAGQDSVTQVAPNSPVVKVKNEPAFIPVQINDESGCGRDKAREMAKGFCDDYEVGNMSKRDALVRTAKAACLRYYETALRLQNTFCSYQKDAVVFGGTLAVKEALKPAIGEQKTAEEVVSKDNANAAKIGREYMKKIAELNAKMKADLNTYGKILGRLNSAAETDLLNEANCGVNATSSEVPGYIRELLVKVSWTAAFTTYDSMSSSARANYGRLKAMKEKAEQNAQLAQMQAIEVGQVLKDQVARAPDTDVDTITLQTSSGIWGPLGQYIAQRGVSYFKPKIAETAGIVGCGVILIAKWGTGDSVISNDNAICFLSVISPEAGLAANLLLVQNRRVNDTADKYRAFMLDQLSKHHGDNAGNNVTSFLLKWARYSQQPYCKVLAAKDAACDGKRDGGAVAYDHSSNCSNDDPIRRAHERDYLPPPTPGDASQSDISGTSNGSAMPSP
jgi:hypothetical protein